MESLDKYEKILKLVTEEFEMKGKKFTLKEEFEKCFVKGNKTSGTRVRKIMQELKNIAQEVREDVQEFKQTL